MTDHTAQAEAFSLQEAPNGAHGLMDVSGEGADVAAASGATLGLLSPPGTFEWLRSSAEALTHTAARFEVLAAVAAPQALLWPLVERVKRARDQMQQVLDDYRDGVPPGLRAKLMAQLIADIAADMATIDEAMGAVSLQGFVAQLETVAQSGPLEWADAESTTWHS